MDRIPENRNTVYRGKCVSFISLAEIVGAGISGWLKSWFGGDDMWEKV